MGDPARTPSTFHLVALDIVIALVQFAVIVISFGERAATTTTGEGEVEPLEGDAEEEEEERMRQGSRNGHEYNALLGSDDDSDDEEWGDNGEGLHTFISVLLFHADESQLHSLTRENV